MADVRDRHQQFLKEKEISLEEAKALRTREEQLKADLMAAEDARDWGEVSGLRVELGLVRDRRRIVRRGAQVKQP